MTKEELKNKISMELKDPILQQGFEIICKENALLKSRNEGFEQQIMGLLIKYEEVYKRFPDLKSAMDKAKAILKENAELKELIKSEHEIEARKNNNLISRLTTAKEIIKDLLGCLYAVKYDRVSDLEQAEQFIEDSEVEK